MNWKSLHQLANLGNKNNQRSVRVKQKGNYFVILLDSRSQSNAVSIKPSFGKRS